MNVVSLILLMSFIVPQVASVFMYYSRKASSVNKSESYAFLSQDLIYGIKGRGPPGQGANASYYENLTLSYSVDERCEGGMPLTMALNTFSPYVEHLVQYYPRMKMKYTFWGVFPELLKKAIPHCCNKSDIRFAKVLLEQSVAAEINPAEEFDFTFPLYGENMKDTMYKRNAFIPVIQAPRVALLVPIDSSSKARYIARQIMDFALIFPFIILTALCSGFIMWLLDRSKNENEFPKPFLSGVWNGIWWAFVTMTTVGYGDRTPKSFFSRLFCVFWILFSIIILSVLSGVITTSLTASTKINFKIHGKRIGAISGSKEFLFGISLNADMQAMKSAMYMFGSLKRKDVDGMLLDNYVTMKHSKRFEENDVRVDRFMDHAITYGIRMAQGSKRLEICLRKYIRDNPQIVLKLLKKNAVQVKADGENQQKKEADRLFSDDDMMKKIRLLGAYTIGAIILLGIVCEIIARTIIHRKLPKPTGGDVKPDRSSFEDLNSSLSELIKQYNSFQHEWVKTMKEAHEETSN